MGKKVSIITRSFNRLEYLIKCINAVRHHTAWGDYEHIILNNNSTDGTRQWLDWIVNMSSEYFPKLKPVHVDENLGDWNGMKYGAELADNPDYIIQLDNDIEVPNLWLPIMIEVLESTGAGIVMLKRNGVQHVLEPKNLREVKTSSGPVIAGEIHCSVACFVVRADDFFKHYQKVKKAYFLAGAIERGCLKIVDMSCHQIEGWDGTDYRQQKKYYKGDIYQKTGD